MSEGQKIKGFCDNTIKNEVLYQNFEGNASDGEGVLRQRDIDRYIER